MNVYVWDDLNRVSSNYHDGGGLVVVADDLDAAMALLRVPGDYGPPVPADSDAFTTPPTTIYPIVAGGEPRVFVFADAGCC